MQNEAKQFNAIQSNAKQFMIKKCVVSVCVWFSVSVRMCVLARVRASVYVRAFVCHMTNDTISHICHSKFAWKMKICYM